MKIQSTPASASCEVLLERRQRRDDERLQHRVGSCRRARGPPSRRPGRAVVWWAACSMRARDGSISGACPPLPCPPPIALCAATRTRIASASSTRRRSAFAELGIDVSVDEIARRAGVGMGTLYRRFPTKDALVDAIFEEHSSSIAAAPSRRSTTADPWTGLLELPQPTWSRGRPPTAGFARSSARASARRGAASRRRAPGCDRSSGGWSSARRRRASCARTSSTRTSPCCSGRRGRVVDATRDVAPAFWRRYLALLVDGLRAAEATAAAAAAAHRRVAQRSDEALRAAGRPLRTTPAAPCAGLAARRLSQVAGYRICFGSAHVRSRSPSSSWS